MNLPKPVTAVVLGAGGRGTGYASYALEHPERLRIVAVAEPREFYRQRMAREHSIPANRAYASWEDLVQEPRLADVAIICTQDAMHTEPAITCAALGYDILLEKPMAPTEDECRRIADAVRQHGIIFGVCHVMRYTPYSRRLKQIVDSGLIGDIASLQHLEPVGFWHQAHSFVRGSWRNEEESSFMLLAKSCHDIDWIYHLMGGECLQVASFGSLKHFTRAEKPAAAGEATRCVECAYEPECPYSALKIYGDFFREGNLSWPVNVVTPEPTEESLRAGLENGPYGRCVYECDNDVVDNQVVIMQFDRGRSACFTMTAFNEGGHRQTRIFGTRGELRCNGEIIEHYDFLTKKAAVLHDATTDPTLAGGHGGGDTGIMDCLVQAVAHRDQSYLLSGADESLLTHQMVFAAERARRESRITVPGN